MRSGDAVQSTTRALLLVLAGCSVGAPSGFSGGDHWTFPLVGPLEDGLLITPAILVLSGRVSSTVFVFIR